MVEGDIAAAIERGCVVVCGGLFECEGEREVRSGAMVLEACLVVEMLMQVLKRRYKGVALGGDLQLRTFEQH